MTMSIDSYPGAPEADDFTVETARDKVARGAALLDEKRPGWHAIIAGDVLRFNMTDGCNCVLGLVFKSEIDPDSVEDGYRVGRRELGIRDVYDAERHGFIALYPGTASQDTNATTDLEDLWLEIINAALIAKITAK